MKPAGLREVERAKADGRWDAAYSSPAPRRYPTSSNAAFRKNAKARRFFESLDSREPLLGAAPHRDREEAGDARAPQSTQFFEMLNNGETIYPPASRARSPRAVSRPGTPSNTAARTPRCASSARNGFASTSAAEAVHARAARSAHRARHRVARQRSRAPRPRRPTCARRRRTRRSRARRHRCPTPRPAPRPTRRRRRSGGAATCASAARRGRR